MDICTFVRQGEEVAEAAACAAERNMHIEKKRIRRLFQPQLLQRNRRLELTIGCLVRIGIEIIAVRGSGNLLFPALKLLRRERRSYVVVFRMLQEIAG
ncbi:hypothetical protein D3C75_1215220 [compost metagenome]